MSAEPSAWGFSTAFRPGDEARAQAAIDALAGSGTRYLRMPLKAEDVAEPWLDWLLPRLAARFDLLPSLSVRDGAPLEELLSRKEHFTHLELRIGATDLAVAESAVARVREHGVRPVLGLPAGFDAAVLAPQTLAGVAAVGLSGAAGGEGAKARIARLRSALLAFGSDAEAWATETGAEAERGRSGQLRGFLEAIGGPADRLYWNLSASNGRREGSGSDLAGPTMLLPRLLAAGGTACVAEVARLAAPHVARPVRPVVITGGSGFIGSNLAESFLVEGGEVVVLDDLSRPGVEENLRWLVGRHGPRVHPALADLGDESALRDAARDASAVIHLAAQTAVTTSLADPLDDFEVNARGTLNLLEAVRAAGRRIPVLFASTNKVYGALEDIAMTETQDHYIPADEGIRAHGVGEGRPLDFCTPYGCSKGVADQYVLDYARSYDIPSAVLRMSCIYGPRQFGTEDQGWVAHFLIRALKGEPISIYGDGKQVRDILHVSDAVAAYRRVLAGINGLSGRAFNLGGGPRNAVSLRLVLAEIERLAGHAVEVRQDAWRQGDQLYFVADTRRLEAETGWTPTVGWRDGLAGLAEWLRENRGLGAAEPAAERITA